MNPVANYHTHTFRCGHATGDVPDYARSASDKGARVLGMTDHVPFPKIDKTWWHSTRMPFEQMDEYEQAIAEARITYPKLTILKGFECEYFRELHGYFEEELLGRRRYDYLIAGTHNIYFDSEWTGYDTPEKLSVYTDSVVASIESGLFAFIAHPDAFGAEYPDWDAHARSCSRAILEAASEYGVPLEINGYGMRKRRIETTAGLRWIYPLLPFWELASEYKIEVVCNSDAHRPEDVMSNIEEGYALARRYNLNIADLTLQNGDTASASRAVERDRRHSVSHSPSLMPPEVL